MTRIRIPFSIGFLVVALAVQSAYAESGSHDTSLLNTLTATESAAGWRLLWDGHTSHRWRSAKSDDFPASTWTLRDGLLSVVPATDSNSNGGADIITRERFADFELAFDFQITPGANSGLKLFVQPGLPTIDEASGKPKGVGSAVGLEFQILDDARHPDAKMGHDGDRTVGSLYDLIAAPVGKSVAAIGEWNTARIVSQGTHVEFWLNGAKTVEFDRGSADFRARVARSKYRDIPNFGEWTDGHILLQDHGDAVRFRNLKICGDATK